MLATVTPSDTLDPRITTYLQDEFISHIDFNEIHGGYIFRENGVDQVCGGLIRALRTTYYPTFSYRTKKRRKIRCKKNSDKTQGKKVDAQIERYIESGGRIMPTHRMALALVQYWTKRNHTLQAAQVPVYVDQFKIVTQADVITRDKDGRLWMWEVKTGYPSCPKQKHKRLFRVKGVVTNHPFNHWELQREFTLRGLIDKGLPVSESRVINVYDEYRKVDQTKVLTIKCRQPQKWAKEI